jgi:hypothetical protein
MVLLSRTDIIDVVRRGCKDLSINFGATVERIELEVLIELHSPTVSPYRRRGESPFSS